MLSGILDFVYMRHRQSQETSVLSQQPNMKVASLFFLPLLSPAILAQSSGNIPNVMNQLNIETIGRQMKDVIGVDIQKNRDLLQELLDLHVNETKKIYNYIDEAIEKLRPHTAPYSSWYCRL